MIAPAALAGFLALAAAAPAAPSSRVDEADANRLAQLERELAYGDRGSARGLAILAEIGALADDAPDLSRVASAYMSAVAGHAHPEVRALALFRLAELERSRGNLQRRAEYLRRLGFVTSWKVIGPFDDEGKRGFDLAYPPEVAVDFSARTPGKVREVAWRDLPSEAVGMGFVHLGGALRPLHEVVAYAVAAVEAAHDERVQLWLGASGAAKVFVNGALAIADPGYHPARLDQHGATVSLRKGRNRILVKLCHASGRMGFYLRLADARGDGRVYDSGDPAAQPPAAGPAPASIEGAVAELSRRAARARGPAAASAWMDLALALDERQSTDSSERLAAAAARRAAEIAPRSIEARLLAARLEDGHGPRRAHLDAALAAAPEDVHVLLALAQDEIDQNRPHAALRLLDRAALEAPSHPAVHMARADALERMGLEARGALEAAEAARRFPTVPGAVRAAARAAQRLGRLDEAVGRLRTLLALRLDDGEARGALARLLAQRVDPAAAAELLAEGVRLSPSDVQERLRLAQLLASNGREAEAEAVFEAAIRLAPEDSDAWEARGRARLLAGLSADAKSDLERALELKPQSPELKELVRSLEPARERFEKPYLLDARALAAAGAPAFHDEDAVVLGELKVTRVFPSGLSATYEQLVVKVLTARGADEFRRRSVSWTPDRQEVRVERARVLKPNGAEDDTHDESERSSSEPWYRLYYDTRAKTLSFPSLAPGDVLEIAWRIEDVAGENLLADYFGDFAMVDEGTPKLRFEYVLLAPETRPIHANAPPGVVRSERKLAGGVVERRFSARDVTRVEFEPNMPGWSEVGRYLHLSTYASWDEVARFYWSLVKEQLRPTEEVRRTAERIAREALAGPSRTAPARPRNGAAQAKARPVGLAAGGLDAAARRAVVGAVYDFVVSQTRYVGLEFGIHGYKPYRVDDVLRRRFGDCKDKASLMHALLESLGIDSRLVLLRMRHLGSIPEAPASLAVFNHAILYVPEMDLWLDGTAAYSGSRELPDEDRGASVLVVNPGSAPRFGTIPVATSGENRTEAVFDVSVGTDGAAAVRGKSRVVGSQAPRYRSSYLSEHDRRAQFEKAFNRTFPGLQVKALAVSDLTRIEDDVDLSFELAVPRYAQADGPGLRFTPFGAGAGYVETYAAQSERRHDLVLDAPAESRFTYRFTLPPGWAAADVPEDASADSPEGGFEVRYRAEGGALLVEGRVTVKAARVPAARYAAFRELAAQVDRAFARRVRIAPTAPEAAR